MSFLDLHMCEITKKLTPWKLRSPRRQRRDAMESRTFLFIHFNIHRLSPRGFAWGPILPQSDHRAEDVDVTNAVLDARGSQEVLKFLLVCVASHQRLQLGWWMVHSHFTRSIGAEFHASTRRFFNSQETFPKDTYPAT